MAVGYIPLDKAYLTAIWLETLFYGASYALLSTRSVCGCAQFSCLTYVRPGINICLFSSYVYILRFRRARKISPIIFWTAVLMFAFSTTHVSLGFYRLIVGFIELRDQPGGPAAYFADVSTPPNVAKITIHSVNSILGDSIVVRPQPSLVVWYALNAGAGRSGDAGTCGEETGKCACCPFS